MRRLWLLLLASALGCVVLNSNYQASESGSGGADGTSGDDTPTTSEPSTTSGGTSTSDADTGDASESVTTDAAPLGDVEFLDEQWAGQFGVAELNDGLRWSDEGVVLEPENPGATLESRIFDAEESAYWVQLQWDPAAPYLREIDADPLPEDTPEVTLVDDLALLLHLNEPPLADGDPVSDAMGLRDGVWFGTETTAVRGVFSRALAHDDGGLGSRIDFSNPVEPGTGPFTWTMWYREEGCDGTTLMALDSPLPSGSVGTGLSFMSCGASDVCGDMETGHAVARIQGPGAVSLARTCSPKFIDDGAWHHIVARRTIEGNGQRLELFVDGESQDDEPADGVVDVSVHDRADVPETFTVAGGNHENFPGPGAYDEVALWNRALTDEEIERVYLRGALIARFQVRACEEPDCHDAEFVGPGGNPGEEFIDPGPKADHAIDLEPLDLRGRYFQYRFQFRRPADAISPAIAAVRAIGVRD